MPRPPRSTKPYQSPQPLVSHISYQQSSTQPPPARTNASLNLSVLRQHYPQTAQILTLAPFSVLYTFSPTTQSWEKCEVEGTLFVCALDAPDEGERYSVVILNRKGLDNFYLELGTAGGEGDGVEVEITEEFTILQAGDKVWGLWIYEEDGDKGTAGVIAECAARATGPTQGEPQVDGQGEDGEEPHLATLNHASGHHHQQAPAHSGQVEADMPFPRRSTAETKQIPYGEQPNTQTQPHISPPSQTSPPDIPIQTHPKTQTHPLPPPQNHPHPPPQIHSSQQQPPQQPAPLPTFVPSADTQFFLSRGPGGSQQLSRKTPQAREQEKKDVLGELFARAKDEYVGKGRL